MPKRFGDYDVMAKRDSPSWNEVTRRAVDARLTPPPRTFFTKREWQLVEEIAELLLPQHDRDERIPIVPFIDRILANNEGNGYRFEGTPPLQQMWREGLAALEGVADIARLQRNPRFFNELLGKVVSVYYAHPSAWNEIGFGGPASPRGYVRLGFDQRDPWEAEETGDG